MTDTVWPGEPREWPGGWPSAEAGWMPVREAAVVLGVSRQRIHYLIAAGRLHARGGGPRLSGAEQAPAGWRLPVRAADQLGVSRQRVHQLIASGALKAPRDRHSPPWTPRSSPQVASRTRRGTYS